MTVSAIVRLAPLVTVDLLKDPGLAGGRDHYQEGALVPLFPDKPLPVWVDHEESRVIVRVRDFFTEIDAGGGRWRWASLTITDKPAWLRTGTGASFGFFELQRQEMPGGWARILRAPLLELSLLSPARTPANPRARVTWVGEPADRKAAKKPAVDLNAWLTLDERAKVAELAREGFDDEHLRRLVEETVSSRVKASNNVPATTLIRTFKTPITIR